ncbi:glycosyltransferase family 4 protein [Glycomyces sp. L485]|uniref:glycosyltransferase family 4 protein n=1 Tax=Glycomyces sp. L485 TaxID=2909235 RepID=UPI001F4BC0BE|nr:glycosyltransferase family 4 protein [Glycomyces sp. L485]MCH7230594.1 glycosyltransferase family 4 protein [Glycomyces sp. L485]
MTTAAARHGGGRVRAAVVIDHPVQYFAPAFRLLAADARLRTSVYYWNEIPGGTYDPGFDRHVRWSTDLHGGYDWWTPRRQAPAWNRGAELLRRLVRDRPSAMLCFGWASPAARLGILHASTTRTPLLYYGDTNPRSTVTRRHPRLRSLGLRGMFRLAAGAVATGAFNREFYLAHGMGPGRVHPGVLPSDVEQFAAAARRGDDSRPLVIGFAGKFIRIKAADDLVAAAARLPRDTPWELRLIGDGPLRPELESLVGECGLRDRVRFLGFKNTDELPALFADVDIMVVPSHLEARGIVAVEAMAAGAAVVVSSATGVWGPGDVLEHERSGLVFPAADTGALTACLQRLMRDGDLRARLAREARVRVAGEGPEGFASTAAAALLAVARRGRR